MRRATFVLLSLALLATACGDDDDDANSSTATATETATAPQTTAIATTSAPATTASPATGEAATTSAPPATTAPSGVEDEQPCMYRSRFVVTTADIQIDGATKIEDYDTFTTIDSENGDFDTESFTAADFESIINGPSPLFLYDVGDLDPLEVALSVQEPGVVDASPVLATTVTGHWGMSPATDPSPGTDPQPTLPPFDSGNSATVAVVDTGYDDTADVPWLSERVRRATSLDGDYAQGRVRGHGTFVASVIVQQQPQTFVRVAAMHPVVTDHFYDVDPVIDDLVNVSNGYLADEFQFLSAINRLLPSALEDGVDALNLSLGTWACKGLTRSALVFGQGLAVWNVFARNAPIVAAAGNFVAEPPEDAVFLPGQMEQAVIGVASLDTTGNQLSTWSNEADC